MKKSLLLSALLLIGLGAYAQSKSTGSVSLLSGMTAEVLLNNTTSTATLTLSGPSNRWFALQFGSFAEGQGMESGQDMVYYNGTTLIDGTMGGVGVTPSADTNNWTVTSNTVVGTTRTIVATRAFVGGANDYTFNYNNGTIDFAFARGASASFSLANHGGNRGYSIGNTFSDVLATDTLSLQELAVYPNPASDVVTIAHKAQLSNIAVINLLGQEVLSQKINSNTASINISGFNTGIYLFKVTVADGRTAAVRVVKQ